MLLAGATVPTQRAFVMICLVLLAVLVDRTAISMRPVAFAAALILLLAPESLLGASFQMSFAAVVALVAGYELLRDRKRREGDRSAALWARWMRGAAVYIGGVALTSVIAMAATAPFAAFHFNRLAGYGLIANILAVPIAALWIMPWGLLAVALMPLGLEGFALTAMGWGIDAVVAIAEAVAGRSGGVLLVPGFSPIALFLMVGGGLWLCLWRKRLAGLAPLALGVILAGQADRPDILVSGDARLVGIVTDGGGRALSTLRRAKFDGEQWLRRDGAGDSAPWPADGAGRVEGLACDVLGCVLAGETGRAALIRDGRALTEDCAAADLVIAFMPVPRGACRGAAVIDRFDLWREGAHAIWLSGGAVRIESVRERQGDRPWVTKR
jgi:competence protein ComEC